MKKLFIAFLIFLPVLGQAQPKQGQPLIDSLLTELSAKKELSTTDNINLADTSKDAILIDLSYDYYAIDPAKGIEYGRQGLILAEKLNWKRGMALANYYLGANYCVKSDYATALDYWLQALKLNEELDNKINVAKTLNNIANVYLGQNNFNKAQEFSRKSLSVFEELKDTVAIAITLADLGSAYKLLSDLDTALDFYNKALIINTKSGNIEAVGSNLASIGLVFLQQKKYGLALDNYFRALKINQDIGSKNGILNNFGLIGQCYLAIAKDTTGKVIRTSLVPVGKTASLLKAVQYLNRSIAICKEIGALEELQDQSKSLSEAEELLGNYKAALAAYKLFAITKDSVFNIDNNVKIANLETKRDLDLKQKDIEIQDKKIALDNLAIAKKKNERGFFIAGLCLLGCIIVVVFRSYKNQQKNNADLKVANTLLTTEKKRSDDLLLNILPAEVAEELKKGGTAHAKQYDNVSVLFTDFVNFTLNAESMTPQQLVGELDICFKAFDAIIDKYNIEKIKTIGDAYLAVSGLPASDPAHAENAVKAAIEINQYIRRRVAELGENTFQIRIGIHSGNVVAGIVGVKKYAYDIWGDTVNTAARMQQNSDPGKINISHTTYELLNDKIACTYRGEIDAKGKGKLKMYFVN